MSSPALRYKGSLLFCKYSLYYSIKPCDSQEVRVPPKKVRVFNKPKDIMTKSEIVRWASRNRYR